MLFLFLMLILVTGTFGEDTSCEYLTILEKGEVKEFSSGFPLNDSQAKCRWNFIADEDRRIILVCPFNEGSDVREDKRDSCGARINVVSDTTLPALPEEDRVENFCRDLTFATVGLNNRMQITFINNQNTYNRTSGFKCYVYAELKSRWDPINIQHKKDLDQDNVPEGCDFHLKLEKNEIIRLRTNFSVEGWQKCRWSAIAPQGSRIALTCPFTDKPPEPLTAQVLPCSSEFVVTTAINTQTFDCSQKSFSVTSTKHVMTLLYKSNVKVPYEQFECYFHWKSPDNDTSIKITKPLPYEYCDHYVEINKTEFFETLHYPKEVEPSAACRVTVVAPENYRIALNCLHRKKPLENPAQELPCRGEIFIELAGGRKTKHCQNNAFFEFSLTNWMIITYHGPVSILHNTFQCYLSVEEMKSEIECEECAEIDKLKFPSSDMTIVLSDVGELADLTSPDYPNPIHDESYSCRWTINHPPETHVFLSCPSFAVLTKDACRYYFTVYPTDDLSSGIMHCAHEAFTAQSSSNSQKMIVTYHGGKHIDPFKCTVSAYYTECDHHITLPRLLHYEAFPLYTPFWPTEVPPWESCSWHYESAPEYRINLYCGNYETPAQQCNRALIISKIGDDKFQEIRVRCLDVNFNETSVSNKLSIRYPDLDTNNIPNQYLGCNVYLDEIRPGLCECGWSPINFRPRIRRLDGGVNKLSNEYPMMAGLLNIKKRRELFCGATIISDHYALTAAFCLVKAEKLRYEVGLLVGTQNLDKDTWGTVLYTVDKMIPHPSFNYTRKIIHTSDIGLVHVEKSILFNVFVKPVCLPFMNRRNTFENQYVTVLGWGINDYELFQNNLLKSEAMVQADDQCPQLQTVYPDNEHICISQKDRRICQADTGGPILWKDPKTSRLQLIGILFRSVFCSETISEHTEVVPFLDWIQENTQGVEFCTRDPFAENYI